MPEYPALACPRLIGTIMFPETFDKTEFEHSNRYRRKYDCDFVISYEFIYSQNEMIQFRDWYKTTLNGGSSWFTADWDILGDTNTKQFHFDEPPEVEIVDKYYKLKATFIAKEI